MLGFRDGDRGHILENIIFFKLLRRGYQIAIGKIDHVEIDFIITRNKEKKYIQVTETLIDPNVRKRELRSLLAVPDNYEKIIITMDKGIMFDEESGIKIVNAIDFLLESEI